MTSTYWRPIPSSDGSRSAEARSLAGSDYIWFDRVERITRAGRVIRPIADIPDDVMLKLTAPRGTPAGIGLQRPRVMGIINVTPDSFSDGGQHPDYRSAVRQGRALIAGGADILDVGGESTRPGATLVPDTEELMRILPVIRNLVTTEKPVSVDTRKATVARAALHAGAAIFNDVSALTFDPDSLAVAKENNSVVCLMHAQGKPATMQAEPRYENVLLDVYDYLQERVNVALMNGIPEERIWVDPGIGFGKTLEHNLALLRGLSLFHGLGCAILIGASRKRFIGTLSGTEAASDRMPGSIAAAIAAVEQGAQIIRVHDVAETVQALSVWRSFATQA